MIVGFTCGAFDFLHPGHIHLLQVAKNMCDELVVGLHTDPTIDRPEKNKPLQTTLERYIQLSALRSVDRIIPYDTEQDLNHILSIFDINRRFVGSDYIKKNITGFDICKRRRIEIVYVSRLHNWSSSSMRTKFKTS